MARHCIYYERQRSGGGGGKNNCRAFKTEEIRKNPKRSLTRFFPLSPPIAKHLSTLSMLLCILYIIKRT